MQSILKLDEPNQLNMSARLKAAAIKIEKNADYAAAVLERESTARYNMLIHIEHYVVTPFGHFPSLS